MEAQGVNGAVSFDGKFVEIRPGKLAVGHSGKRIPLSAITGVAWKEPSTLIRGFIRFETAAATTVGKKRTASSVNAAKDENAVVFKSSQREAFAAVRSAVETAMA